MALSFVEHIADGKTSEFAVPFPYLERAHVKVSIAGQPQAVTWSSGSVVTTATPPAANSIVKIYRETPNVRRLVDFEDIMEIILE